MYHHHRTKNTTTREMGIHGVLMVSLMRGAEVVGLMVLTVNLPYGTGRSTCTLV